MMPDREKVIKGLELCTAISQDGCLMLCPYKDEQDETYSGFCEQVLKRDALALLKEQQPKKGHWETKIIRGDKAMCCSVCGEDSGTIYDYLFCPNCGAYMTKDGEHK